MRAVAPAAEFSAKRGSSRILSNHRLRSKNRFIYRVLQLADRVASQPQWKVFGHYSVSKLDALNEFQRTATRTHILIYVLASALPSLIINVALEAIPLAPPRLGWSHSATFLARFFFTMLVTSIPPIANKSEYIPEFPVISWRGVFLHSLLQSIVGISVCVAIAFFTDIYPFPLFQFVPALPMTLVGKLSIFSSHFAHLPGVQEREKRINNLMAIEQMPVVIYPMFAALFMVSSPNLQLCLSAVLPVLKFVIRSVLVHAGWHDTDLLGVLTGAAGHLYHVLFVATCLQNSKSLQTMAVIVAFSFLQMLFNAYDISKSATRVRISWREVRDLSSTLVDEVGSSSGDFVAVAVKLASEESVGRSLHLDKPRIFLSTYKRYCRPEFLARNQAILVHQRAPLLQRQCQQIVLPNQSLKRASTSSSPLRRPSRYPGVWAFRQRAQSQRVTPAPNSQRHLIVLTRSRRAKRRFVLEVCATLHQTEIIVLRSYITISILLFYAVYLIVVFWLPNREYFLTMRFMTTIDAVGDTVTRLIALCALECVFATVYLLLLRKKLGISGWTQLAFVLSTQRRLFQAKCIALPVVILGFPLEHFGNGIILNFGHEPRK